MNFDALALPVQMVEESEMHQWREGHSLRWKEQTDPGECEVCYDNTGEGMFVCDGNCLFPSRSNYRLFFNCPPSMSGCCYITMFIPCEFLSGSYPRSVPTMFRVLVV